MPNGRTRAIASATFSGVSPPASTIRRVRRDRRGGGPVDRPAGAAAPHRVVHVEQQRHARPAMRDALGVPGADATPP